VRAAMAILLLAPSPPLLFMGEEFGADTPFLFFCDFEKDLAAAVTSGRRNEFARFAQFSDPAERERIPDPSADKTFEVSRLDWSELNEPIHRDWLRFYQTLLNLRSQHVVPHLSAGCVVTSDYEIHGAHGLTAYWKFPDNVKLILIANLGNDSLSGLIVPGSKIIYESEEMNASAVKQGILPPWSVAWFLES